MKLACRMSTLDETHDAQVESWVESANEKDSDFPLQNLPFGVFRRREAGAKPKTGVAIGDRVLDLAGMRSEGLLDNHHGSRGSCGPRREACASESLNALMALRSGPRHALRRRIHAILRQDAPASDRQAASRHLVAQSDVNMVLPAVVGDYTDFYASIFHAGNVGKLFRPDNPLLPNYKYIPIGYHGRALSLVPSGTPIRRPCGQTRNGDAAPKFGPTRSLDYELELGFFVSAGNSLGETIPIALAEEDIFGICLVNDWSARDIQAWEYQPLGPFLAKSFATSLSPWVVTMEALAPFRTSCFCATRGRSAAIALSFRPGGSRSWRSRPLAGGFSLFGPHARGRRRCGGFGPQQFPRHVLDHGANADPSRQQWLQSASRRFAGQRNRLRRRPDRARVPAGANRARQESGHSAQWRAAKLSGRRRRSHPPRILRARRLPPHRTGHLPGDGSSRFFKLTAVDKFVV